MKRSGLSAAVFAFVAGLVSSPMVHAQDSALTASHDLYFSGTVGGGVMKFGGPKTIALTYYGVDASAEVCRANVNSWDLCGGANLFRSLGGGTKTTTAGLFNFTTKTDVTAIGGFVKARKQMDQFAIAPYAGFRRFLIKTDVSGLGMPTTVKENGNAVFGGVEFDYNLMDEKVFLSVKAEVGRSFGGPINRTSFLFAPGLKVKF
ncbi:hypothetical protein [Hoeflea sp.]|uniref:hypothetical protein n=1 Tax=Hoeflea sp. TaxID=1940281 RepID=UPI003748EF88